MKRRLILLSLLAALLVSVVAPSFAPRVQAATPAMSITHTPTIPAQPGATHVAKGRIAFLIHIGIAFFFFHHVYKRYKQGYYHGFHPVRWTAAAAEILIGVHELRKARDSANNSNSAVLHALAKPLNVLSAKMESLRSNINAGDFNSAQFSSIDSSVRSFKQQAAHNGMAVVESATGT
jgi:hypothetical protein